MVENHELLDDSAAAIWYREYAQKQAEQSKEKAVQFAKAFRKNHRAIGVADQMKLHAEFVDPLTKDRYLVSWLPVPLFDTVDKNVAEQRAVLDMFKVESGLPAACQVSFGSADHITGMAMAHFNVTQIDPFNGLIVNTDSHNIWDARLRLQWADGRIFQSAWSWDEDRFPNVGAFAVCVIKALPIPELIPDGYEQIPDIVELYKFEMNDLEFFSCLEKGEDPVRGREIRKRAICRKADFDLGAAKYMMVRSAEILAHVKSVLFPGTRLLSKSSFQVMPYIHRQDDGSWRLGYLQIDANFFKEDYLVRRKQDEEAA